MIAGSFWSFLILSLAVALIKGRRLERHFAILLLLGVVATYLFNICLGWTNAQPYVLLVDSVVLFVALGLTATTDRYWPIWYSAFQAIGVASGFSQALFPNQVPAMYIAMQGFWFLPAAISMVVGIMLDRSLPENEFWG